MRTSKVPNKGDEVNSLNQCIISPLQTITEAAHLIALRIRRGADCTLIRRERGRRDVDPANITKAALKSAGTVERQRCVRLQFSPSTPFPLKWTWPHKLHAGSAEKIGVTEKPSRKRGAGLCSQRSSLSINERVARLLRRYTFLNCADLADWCKSH